MKTLAKKLAAFSVCLSIVLFICGCIVESLFSYSNIPAGSGLGDNDADGALDYAVLDLGDAIRLVFRESVDPASFSPETGLAVSPAHDFALSFENTTATNDTLVLTPISPYVPGQVYHVTLAEDAVMPADAGSSWRITSEVHRYFMAADKSADTNHPFIASLYPLQDATDVPCDAVLSVEFSEAMMAIRAYTHSDSPELPSDLAIDGSQNPLYTATTVEGLTPNTTYTIVFDPEDSEWIVGTTDQTGNRLVANAWATVPAQVVWSFTTGTCQNPVSRSANRPEVKATALTSPASDLISIGTAD